MSLPIKGPHAVLQCPGHNKKKNNQLANQDQYNSQLAQKKCKSSSYGARSLKNESSASLLRNCFFHGFSFCRANSFFSLRTLFARQNENSAAYKVRTLTQPCEANAVPFFCRAVMACNISAVQGNGCTGLLTNLLRCV